MTPQNKAKKLGAKTLNLLADLSNASGVSGAEAQVRSIILESLKGSAFETQEDALGNVIAHRPASCKNAKKVLLTAHMDEAGFMITGDDGDGLYSFEPVGGVDVRQMPGKPVLIGKNRVPGVIGARAIHLTTAEQRRAAIPLSTLRIDVGPKVKVEAGERAVFAAEFRQEGKSLFGKALDNRLGVLALIELLKTAPDALDVYGVFSSQKGIGNRGEMVAAYRIDPDYVILIDSAEAADLPSGSKGELAPWHGCKLGNGPVIYPMHKKIFSDARLFEHFIHTAEENGIPHQIGQAGALENYFESAASINKIRAGLRSIQVSVPVRYPNTAISLANQSDLENSIHLLSAGLGGLAAL